MSTAASTTIFELVIDFFSFRGDPSADPFEILPQNPSADPSAEFFRGSFRKIRFLESIILAQLFASGLVGFTMLPHNGKLS